MRRAPARRATAALLTAAALGIPASAAGQATMPEPTAPDFEAVLLADARVIPAVKAALRDDRAFAQPAAFGDLTADGTSDAVVLVTVPGAAGAIAAYVLSTEGVEDAALKVIYRSQALHRALVRVSRGALIVITPAHARGDDVCCPAARLERTYVRDRRTRVFRRTASRRIARTPS